MEDTNNSKSQPIATDPKKGPIIELTPAQEVRGAVRGKIIDLVQEHPSQPPAGIDVAPTLSGPATANGEVSTEPVRAPLKTDNPEPVETALQRAEFAPTDQPDPPTSVSEIASGQESISDAPDPLDTIASELELSLDNSDTPQPTDLLNVDGNIEETELSLDTHHAPVEAYARADAPESDDFSDDLDDLLQPDDGADAGNPREAIQAAPVEDPVDPQPNDPAFILEDDDDEILELSDAVTPAEPGATADGPQGGLPVEDDDPIIELTEILDPAPAADLAAACQDDGDDEILELTDIVDPGELFAPAEVAQAISTIEDDEDPIIELTDAVDPVQADAPATIPDDDGDVVAEMSVENSAWETAESDITWPEDGQPEAEAAQNQALDPTPELTPAPTESSPDTVIRLDSVLKAHKQRIAEQVTRQIDEELAADQDEDEARTGLELENADHWSTQSIGLTEERLQKAIEQVIRTQYARRIEEMIASTVERVVTREMESIRNSLMRDGEPEA